MPSKRAYRAKKRTHKRPRMGALQILRPELHYTYAPYLAATLGTANTASFIYGSGTPISDLSTGRTGNKIAPMWFKWSASYESTITNQANSLRRIILIDWNNDGTPPTQAEVLAVPADYLSIKNYDNSQRFTILKDDLFTIYAPGASTVTTVDKVHINLERYYNKKRKNLCYQGSTGAKADAASGAIYVMWIPKQTDAGAGSVQYDASMGFLSN